MDKRYLEFTNNLAADERLLPVRDGTAASWLRGTVPVNKYAEGKPVHVTAPVCVVKRKPDDSALIDTQLLYGEDFIAYGEQENWLWGQSPRDYYVGWVRKNHVTMGLSDATHQIMSRGTFLYSDADIKSQPIMKIPMASQVTVIGSQTTRGVDYLQTKEGWLVKKHVRTLGKNARDFVMVGESMIGMTYLWAGRSTFGMDCSGLVQTALQLAGIAVLRDSDMQEATIGEAVDIRPDLSGLKRGDLVFWPGHVGMMRDRETLLHANGHTMTVFSEPLVDAVERVAYLYGQPRAIRRPFALAKQRDSSRESAPNIVMMKTG